MIAYIINWGKRRGITRVWNIRLITVQKWITGRSYPCIYNSALKEEIGTKLEILNDEFQHVHRYNPIEHIKSRIKTSESIVKKLKKNGYESTIENMVKYVNDIAGIRIICSFTNGYLSDC